MSRSSRQLGLVLFVAIAIAAIASHGVASWLKVKTTAAQPFAFGKPNGKPPAFLAGSSLASYGISWELISTQLGLEIKVWGIAGGSPYEWEQFQRQVPEAKTTFIVVSAYDLDEAMVCDFRAAIVPVGQSIQALREAHADWSDSKRALSQYPLTWLRTLFPTLGRSRGVMGKLRENIGNLIKSADGPAGTEAGPTLEFGKRKVVDPYKLLRVSDWSTSEVVGKLAAMRAGMEGNQAFTGAKKFAFMRMLRYANQRGRSIVIVLPVSPAYSKEFMSPSLTQQFEAALAGDQKEMPQTEWLRLDQPPDLAANENFCDLVHMNVFGQKLATDALQAWLQSNLQP